LLTNVSRLISAAEHRNDRSGNRRFIPLNDPSEREFVARTRTLDQFAV
jgi:hypothetical protein